VIPDHVPTAGYQPVAPDQYLDARRPEWLDAEMLGHVTYDKIRREVRIHRTDIYKLVDGHSVGGPA
jgi:hypothetical protein